MLGRFYLVVHLPARVPISPDVCFWMNWTSNSGAAWVGLATALWAFRYESSILRRKVSCERREGVLWVCRSSRQMEDFHFLATRRSGLWLRGRHWVVRTARICGGALCLRVVAEVYAWADSSHAFQFSSSDAASENHDIPCRIYPATFVHI